MSELLYGVLEINWRDIMDYLVVLAVITTYTALGMGAATAEKIIRKNENMSNMTIFFWPAALITWLVYQDI